MLSNKLHSYIGNTDKLYVDDVFSAYTYTGNGSTQTINNGIDLAGEGGMVWTKERSSSRDHSLFDTARGVTSKLLSNSTNGNYSAATEVTAFNSNGYSLGTSPQTNGTAQTYVSWTFRKAPKFFDVVTYTGNGANRTIPHALGQEVGQIIIKRTDASSDWQVYHRSLANTEYMVLNSTAVKTSGATRWNSTTPTTSVFSLGTDASVNASGGTYVAYLFAHDTSATGIIQCGSFTGSVDVNLGWEAQYVLMKDAGGTGNWYVLDTMRGMSYSQGQVLSPNTSGSESAAGSWIIPTATGFRNVGGGNDIYLAIRRPNKPPTTGTQVYNAVTYTGNSTGSTKQTIATGFPPDAVLIRTYRTDSGGATIFGDRLRGNGSRSNTYSTATETIGTARYNYSDNMQFVVGPDPEVNPGYAGGTCVSSAFKRAPGFFDVVCYTGTGSAQTVNHSLGVAPELIIIKSRSATGNWPVYATVTGLGRLHLNLIQALETAYTAMWNAAHPTNTVFSIGPDGYGVNNNNVTYVAYLFASLPGISKVGAYIGNEATLTVDCGFSTGARFVLIKRTNTYGDWFVFDTARGIVSGSDPFLLLNTTDSEDGSRDVIDPHPSGFTVNYSAGAVINAYGSTYLYLAIA